MKKIKINCSCDYFQLFALNHGRTINLNRARQPRARCEYKTRSDAFFKRGNVIFGSGLDFQPILKIVKS